MVHKGLIIIISGPSGVGKTTISNKLLAELKGLRRCVTYTTRKRRPDERNGVDYHFVDENTFKNLVKDEKLAEWAEIHGYKYGTPKSRIDEIITSGNDIILVIDVKGAQSIKALYPSALSIFIKPPSIDTLKDRLKGRGEADRINIRLNRAEMEMNHMSGYEYVLVNDNLNNTISSLKRIINKARHTIE